MKKILFLTSMALVAAVSFSCNKENIEGNDIVNGEETVLYAPQTVITASSTETKTTLSGLEILWEKGDVISLFIENGTPMDYNLIEGNGTTSGKFEAASEPETGFSYAVYPAVSGQASGKSVAMTVAANQIYVVEGFSTDFPMGAVTSDGLNFTFTNLATVLSLPLQGDAVVRSISIEAVGGEGLAGDATVDFSGATPVLTAGNSSTVTLDCGESGVQLSADAATVFNFILIPGEYSGLKVSVTDVNGSVTERTTGALALVAGSIKNFNGSLTVSSAPQGWNLVGSFVGDNTLDDWSSWIEMEGGNGLYYCKNVTVPAEEDRNQFKVRYGANEWYGYSNKGTVTSVTLQKVFTIYRTGGVPGSGDEWPGKDEGNLRVEPAGTYDFYFVENNHEVIVMHAGDAPFVLTGTINGWGETPFEIENGLMIARNISFSGNDVFKIKVAKISDDDEGKNWDGGYNLGSNGQPITPGEYYYPVNGTNDNISTSVTGTYDITFDIKNNSIIMTASQN